MREAEGAVEIHGERRETYRKGAVETREERPRDRVTAGEKPGDRD